MKLRKISKKFLVIVIILSLIFSFNLTISVSANNIIDNKNGVYYDNFNNANYINIEEVDGEPSCLLTDGVITLNEGDPKVLYDQKETPGKIDAWEISDWEVKLLGGGLLDFLGQFVSPDSPLVPKVEFDTDAGDYKAIEADDGNTVVTSTNLHQFKIFYPMHQFRFKTDYNRNTVKNIYFEWNFGPYKSNYNLDKISMFAWRYDTPLPRWEELVTKDYSSNSAEIVLGSNETEQYLSDEGYVDILIIGTPLQTNDVSQIATDYVKIELTLVKGYFQKGYVTSTDISPDTDRLYGWESLIWTGSRPSTVANIKIHVLDESGNIINSLDGNTKGYTTSPIDLSSLNKDTYKIIKLQANFTSDSIAFSPRLYSWGVLWQTQTGFMDSFENTYRIDETNGVKIEHGEVKVSEFYSNWEIFGKNPSNTRSYIGPKPESNEDSDKTYWISDQDSKIGGGFRSPVVSDGVVYVASEENKIYAFNLTADTDWEEREFQIPFNSSMSGYNVESSLAIGDGKVVFGTSELNVNDNKIYALNASELNDVLWTYPAENNSDFICFSAAPTIANDRVFITSCNGLFADPYVSLLINKFNNLLRDFSASIGITPIEIFKTNKLYALDLQSGNPIWKFPVRLPGSSYSTPAVDNGLIFVGCDNLDGSSLLCYDENSGQLIWNASVGLVGRSSPVVGEINGNKAVFVMGRERSIISNSGTDTIYAFNAETGEFLWNVTFEGNSTSRWFLLRGYGINNLAPLASPISTPAFDNGVLYVLSQPGVLYALDVNNNGEEKWSYDVRAGGSIVGDILLPYHCASPVVVDDTVYVVNKNSYIYALDITNQGSVEWEYKIVDTRYLPPEPENLLFSSPIITDKLLVASTVEYRSHTEDLGYFAGRMYAIGKYERNSEGKITSIPIHVQKGKWWKEFNAIYTPSDSNNISFAILDENGNSFSGLSNLDGSHNSLSNIKSNVVKLSAKLTNKTSEDLILESWSIDWDIENRAPEFVKNSFRAGEGQEGWINLKDIPECSIEVRDKGVGNVISGLDIDSAKFTLEYIPKGSNELVTKEFDAYSEDESGVISTRIIAKISELDIEFEDLEKISFYIKDLAQNENTSFTTEFNIDTGIPSSKILDISEYKDKYNNPVRVKANGSDDNSGVASIALYYKDQDDIDWVQYGSTESPFIWEFYRSNSSYYELCSIAKDYAGNTESLPEEGVVSFYYDQNNPEKPEFEDKYAFKELPTFDDVTFTDDYKLQSIEYRIFEDYIEIADNIDSDSYNEEFTISQSDWNRMIEDNTYYMYFRVTDFCGNKYETPLDSDALVLEKDITPPIANLKIDLSDFAGGGWKENYIISADIFEEIIEDFDSAGLEYSYSADKEKWSDWEQYGDKLSSEPFEWDFDAKEGSGYYKFKIKVYDDAGSFWESKPETVNVTLFPAVSFILMIILIVILIFVTFLIKKKYKKKK